MNGVEDAGRHSVAWDGRDDHARSVSPGVYFYRLDSGYFRTMRKMVLAK